MTPFIPAWSLPGPDDVAEGVTLWQPRAGGHVGFACGAPPGELDALPRAVLDWMARQGDRVTGEGQ